MMKHNCIKRIIPACLAAILVLCTGCSDQVAQPYVLPDTMPQAASRIAENERFALEWDELSGCVLLRDKASDHVWSTTPYDHHLTGENNYTLASSLAIEYYNVADAAILTAKSMDCVYNFQFSSQAVENGVKTTWYFAEPEITLSVTYTLREDSLQVSLNTDDIRESGKSHLLRVSVAPYLCSTKNTTDENRYLFVPSGSGALLYTDSQPGDMPRVYTGEVYGNDPVRTRLDDPAEEQAIRLPVFGVKDGEHAMLAIIEEGDNAASIEAQAGNPRNNYSNVYATFQVRGYDNIENGTNDTILLSNGIPANREYVVGYYPLTGDKANYSGMAAGYREYLLQKGLLKEAGPQAAYHVTMVGAVEIDTFTLGIPHTTLMPLTTFSKAQTILTELAESTGRMPQALLQGVGSSGINCGQLAGGYTFAGALGGAKGHKSLEAFCREQGATLYTDFDVLQYTRSGDGFNPLLHAALSAGNRTAVKYPLKPNVRVPDTDREKMRLLKRSKVMEAVSKLATFCGDTVSGVGLSTLGNLAYSDYSESVYDMRGQMQAQVREGIAKIAGAGHSVHLTEANGYAAGLADSLSDVPLQHGGYDALDATVPFYAMVYRGYIPLYSTAMNLSPDTTAQLLRAVEAGVSPAFTLVESVDREAGYSTAANFYGLVYRNNAALIRDTVERTAAYLEQVEGAAIVSHTIPAEGITRTTFDNGVMVTVNHTDTPVELDGQTLPAKDFRVEGAPGK